MNATPKKGKRVGIWVRVSTEDQAVGESPQHHEYRARQYAEFQGWAVIEVYDLAGVSGKSVWEHPECQRMLRDLKRGHIQGLIFSKLARLARNTRELLDFADVFDAHKAALVSIEEKIDTSTPAGLLFYTMLGAIAQWEREEIAARIRASVSVRAKLGRQLSGRAPYGFKWEDKKLVQLPKEAAARRLAFEAFIEHQRKGHVARLLNAKGHRTREGKEFRDTHIRRMLECPSAMGIYRTNTHKLNPNGKGWRRKPESEWGSIPCPAIVSEAVFRRANEILEQQSKPAAKPGKKPAHTFAGVLRCACGGKMYVYTRSPNYTCTRCKNKIGASELDGLFLDCIKDTLADSGQIAAQIAAAKAKIAQRSGEIAAARVELDAVKAEMRKIYDLYIAGGVDVAGFKAINQPLEEKLTRLTESLARLEGEVSARQVNDLSVAAISQEARSLSNAWTGLDADGKQRIVAMLCKEIVVPDKDPDAPIEMTLTHSPPRDDDNEDGPTIPRPSGPKGRPPSDAAGGVPDSSSNRPNTPRNLQSSASCCGRVPRLGSLATSATSGYHRSPRAFTAVGG